MSMTPRKPNEIPDLKLKLKGSDIEVNVIYRACGGIEPEWQFLLDNYHPADNCFATRLTFSREVVELLRNALNELEQREAGAPI